MGPVIVTSIGILFLLSEMGGSYFHVGHTYPVIFIVIGVILLASAMAPMEGHVEFPGAIPQNPVPPPYSNPYSGQGQ